MSSTVQTNRIQHSTGTGDNITLDDQGNVVAAADIQSTSQNGGQLAGFRNVLINGGMIVNQRLNNGGAPSSKWITDRWSNDGFAQISEARTLYEPIPKGSTRAIELTLNGTAGVLTQPVEVDGSSNGQFEVGSTWTLSWWTTNTIPQCNCYWFDSNSVVGLVSWTKVGGIQTLETDNGYTRLAQTFTVTARTNPGHTQLNVEFGSGGTSGLVSLTNAQLEPGHVATPFEHRPFGTEQYLCERYFQLLPRLSMFAVTTDASNSRACSVSFRNAMRVAPTYTAGQDVRLSGVSTTNSNNFGMTIEGVSTEDGRSSYILDLRFDAEF